MTNKGEGSFIPIFFIMIVSLAIAFFWNSSPAIKNSVHFILDPTLGALINWNLTLGMFILIFLVSLVTTLVQKYATDQATIKELKKEQKRLSEESKKYKDHPEKIMEFQKDLFPISGKIMKLSMRGIMFTGIPFILLFRWFYDFFEVIGNPKFFGFFSWFWFYLIFAIIFGSILRKVLKVV